MVFQSVYNPLVTTNPIKINNKNIVVKNIFVYMQCKDDKYFVIAT